MSVTFSGTLFGPNYVASVVDNGDGKYTVTKLLQEYGSGSPGNTTHTYKGAELNGTVSAIGNPVSGTTFDQLTAIGGHGGGYALEYIPFYYGSQPAAESTVVAVNSNSIVVSGNLLPDYSGGAAGLILLSQLPLIDGQVVDFAGSSIADYRYSQYNGLSAAPVPVAPCYLRGTRILTPDGERSVETIAIGDAVTTASGEHRQVRWIGKRSYSGLFARKNPAVQPILIRAGALEEGKPHRDLYVSPQHAMYLDGFLVPAECLVNGLSVMRVQPFDEINYYHIELESHDILVAENAPSESFVDCDSRGLFQNAYDHDAHARTAPARWVFCAPRLEDGPDLQAIHDRIAVRAGQPMASVQPGPLEGRVDVANMDEISGWAWQASDPETPAILEILVNGGVIARVVANRQRTDVKAAGFGNGRSGFLLQLTTPLSPFLRHEIVVRRSMDHRPVETSPRVLEPVAKLRETDCEALARLLADQVTAPRDIRRILAATLNHAAEALVPDDKPRRRTARTHAERTQEGRLAVIVDDRLPDCTRDAGSCAIVDHMRALMSIGWQVAFLPRDLLIDGRATQLDALAVEILGAPQYQSVEEALRALGGRVGLVYLHRMQAAAQYLEIARDLHPRSRIVYSVADLHHLRAERQAIATAQPNLTALAARWRERELSACRAADLVITHSSAEASLLNRLLPDTTVKVIPWSFKQSKPLPFSQRSGVAFVGSCQHAPNADAVRYLVQAVMPRVHALDPNIVCYLIGSCIPDDISAAPYIRVVGPVADLASVLGAVRLTVAPLRFGAGLKGKVLTSFAAGLPCVVTPVAVEGLDLPSTLNACIAADPVSLAERIVTIHRDPVLNAAMGRAGSSLVRARYSQQRIDSLLLDAIGPPNGHGLQQTQRNRDRLARAG